MKLPLFRQLAIALPLALSGLPRMNGAPAEEVPTVITCDGEGQMIGTEKDTSTITFRDNVVVTGTNLKLTCDFLQAVILRGGDPNATIGKPQKFRSMVATGHVHIVQGEREAACGRAELFPEQDRIILTESPVVVDREQNTRASGKKITFINGQRQFLIEEPTLVGPPVKDLGFDKDKDKKPEGAPPAPKQP